MYQAFQYLFILFKVLTEVYNTNVILLLVSKMKKDTQMMNKLMQRSHATNGNDTRSVVEVRLLNS